MKQKYKGKVIVRLFILVILVFFAACKPQSDYIFSEEMLAQIPDSVLQVDQMASILVDVHLAEAIVQESQVDSVRANRDKILAGYYGRIMQMHQTNQSDFENSYKYYTDHPLLLNYVYQQVTEKLSIMESKYK